MIERAKAASVLRDLVKIESINPDLVSGGSGEGNIARYVVERLKRQGLKAHYRDLGRQRANALGILPGRGGGRSLMLNGHLDTVGVIGMRDPFSARMEDGRLYGRGAQDMKGGIAAALVAVEVLARGPRLKGDVVVAAVADEEHKSLGTRALLEEVRTDAAIVLEPTGLEVATAHKGFVWAQIKTRGRAAHGSRPQEGLDAIVFMGQVLRGLEKLQATLDAGLAHPLLGSASVHASLISGGQELSSYPAECSLALERRLLPGEDAATFEEELRELLSRLSAADANFCAELNMSYSALAFEIARDCTIAQILLDSARKVLGPPARFGAQSFWTDAALLSEAGIPTVLFGPGGAGLHSADEYVRLEDVALCAEALIECAQAYCES